MIDPTRLQAGEHCEAFNEPPYELPGRLVRYPTVAVEHHERLRYQHSAFKPRPHAEPPQNGQPRRLR
jgi:hypothetical protein